MAAQLKLDKPEKYEGDARELQNWLFNLSQYCTACRVIDDREQVKVAVTFLAGQALMWWRAVSIEPWATLGSCTWLDFTTQISAEFQDVHHQLRHQTKLFDLRQKGSVQRYNEEFRALMLEVRHVMSTQDILLAYLRGLKP